MMTPKQAMTWEADQAKKAAAAKAANTCTREISREERALHAKWAREALAGAPFAEKLVGLLVASPERLSSGRILYRMRMGRQ